MAWLICILVCGAALLQGKSSGYQQEPVSQCELLRSVTVTKQQKYIPHCAANGRLRNVQGQCWCVDAEGQEVIGTRTNNSASSCPSTSLIKSVLHCSPSGNFKAVQCDSIRGECWCVDPDGMEVPGTRQNGRPETCPGSCDLMSQGLLPTSGSGFPPQCSDDGSFLPVQCKFINMTNALEINLLEAYRSLPEAFESLSNFRKFFPMVSSYCFCADSRGREIPNTGVELLLSNIISPTGPLFGQSFTQSKIYRILQRRTLGIHFALTGHFRCPSPCEEERRVATEASSVFVPSCDGKGSFSSKQCQKGGQCWCVDPMGKEIPGTRQRRDSLVCGSGSSFVSCPAHYNLIQVLDSLFPSVDSALKELANSSPGYLESILFGGKFLENAATFNFSGEVKNREALGLDRLSSKDVLQKNLNLIQTVSQVLRDPTFFSAFQNFLMGMTSSKSTSPQQIFGPQLHSCPDDNEDASSIFIPRSIPSGGFQEQQCQANECWCVDSRGQEVAGSRTTGRRPRCPSRCERERAMALKVKGNLAAGGEIYVPACSEDGAFLALQCVGFRCFCVDAEGKSMAAGPTGGDITCPLISEKLQSSAGTCSLVLSKVIAFRQQVKSIITTFNSSNFPLGNDRLLAEVLRLSPVELQTDESEEMLISDRLLSRSNAALRLAAFSTLQMFAAPMSQFDEPYSPQCDSDGNWRNTQCYHGTGQCWCVDEDGVYIPDSLTKHSGRQCLTRCQRAQSQSLLSDWMKGSDIMKTTSSYRPKCEKDGRFSVLQTGGAAGWCVNPVSGEIIQTATQSSAGQYTCPSWCRLRDSQCQPDGSFTPLQCDSASCWCVSVSGLEVNGTRMLRSTGQTPSCDRPLCPTPLITHGALVCQQTDSGLQSCELICHQGYQNALPVSNFLCETLNGQWSGDDKPLSEACQISQPFQIVSSSQTWSLSSPCSEISSLQTQLFELMTNGGLCSAKLPASSRSVSLCHNQSVSLQCDGDNMLKLKLSSTVDLRELSDISKLSDIKWSLKESLLLKGVQGILDNLRSKLGSDPKQVSGSKPTFGCSSGYHLDSDGKGCVVCPAGSYSREGACLLCPEGTYQDEEGRDFCNQCPRGSSATGASSVNECVTECQKRGLRCSDQGQFLSAQPDFLSDSWTCVSTKGAELQWTKSDRPLTDEECSVLSKFQPVPGSDLVIGAEDTEVLKTMTSDLNTCVQACAADPSCHHVAFFKRQSQCELYSTLNTHCNTSQQTTGFLGNPQAEVLDGLICFLSVRGGASDLMVIRKKGAEFERHTMLKAISGVFRTQVFSSKQTSLSDAHLFCQSGCRQDACCDGFILNQNSLNGGSLLCGWLRSPSALMCGDRDWDVIGQGTSSRDCGVGLTLKEQQQSLVFDFGGQKFTIPDSVLPPDNQTSIASFQAIYLKTDVDSSAAGSGPCSAAEPIPPLDDSVQLKFDPLSNDDVLVDPQRNLPTLSFMINKIAYNSQQALLWCLSRCKTELQCSIVDLRDSESPGFYRCLLFTDNRDCGAFNKPMRGPCRPVLDKTPSNAYIKKVNLSGPPKNFYQRVSFQKMVSFSVQNRYSLAQNTTLSAGFKECERHCDEDPCCRGIGFVRDTNSSDITCLSLISLGIQICSDEDQTTWRTQDCQPSMFVTKPYPLGWYQKPVHQVDPLPAVCPVFNLPKLKNNVSLDHWTLLSNSSVLINPSLTTYDVIHLSQNIATNQEEIRDWCLHACQEAESCVAVSLRKVESGVRCIHYPDTRVCGLSSAPGSPSPTSSCQLVIREPASQVYMRTDWSPLVTSISIPGHGTLQGVAVDTSLGANRKTVVQFLGVPYARPPIGSLRFTAAQPANWTGNWDATKPRPSCIQPGDMDAAVSSEDCLYLNIFSPARLTGRVPVLVFFSNFQANKTNGLLDASSLAALGNIVVVTANYRTGALGFLRTGSSGLFGNYGLSDQVAVLRWVNAHISLVGGDNRSVTVGAERQGADISSLHLLSSSSSPLFQRMILMGGSVFSPSLLANSSRTLAVELAKELGCVTSDPTDDNLMISCLRATPVQKLKDSQTKLLSVRGPFQSWGPVRQSFSQSFHRVDLLLGTSGHDGLISRARKIKDFEVLQGRTDGKTAFYEALSRSLGGVKGSGQLKDAASWFYTLDHSPTPSGYNLFSRALDNATRDFFIICPSLQMAQHWANSKANVYLYHQPATENRADTLIPLDVQLVFGVPHQPISAQRFSSSERRLSLAMMTYVSSFVKTGNPNPSPVWSELALPQWRRVLPSAAPPTYMQLSPDLSQQQGLRQNACSFWTELGPILSPDTSISEGDTVGSNQPVTEKDAYN